MPLIGRTAERARVDALLAAAREGRSEAPLLDALDTIPPAQAGALRGALALSTASPTSQDRFAVSAAVLSLLAGAAEARPVLLAVDDLQWLDPSSLEALLFAGRRLRAEGIALLATMRSGYAIAAPWLERLEIGPLPAGDARRLLAARQGERMAPTVSERLVENAAGNPLALLEIPTLLTDAQLAGREPLETPLPAGTGIQRAFRRRIDELPEDARRALLVAAASDSARPATILRGLEAVGLDEHALE